MLDSLAVTDDRPSGVLGLRLGEGLDDAEASLVHVGYKSLGQRPSDQRLTYRCTTGLLTGVWVFVVGRKDDPGGKPVVSRIVVQWPTTVLAAGVCAEYQQIGSELIAKLGAPLRQGTGGCNFHDFRDMEETYLVWELHGRRIVLAVGYIWDSNSAQLHIGIGSEDAGPAPIDR